MASIGADDATGLSWLDDAKENAEWYTALAALDVRGDKQPLITLLQSGEQVPNSIAFYLGDLLERYNLKHKARPRTPGYLRTPEQLKLIAGIIHVHKLVHRDGVARAKALADVAAEFGLPEETLSSAYQGKHGALRRARQRWHRP